MHPRQKEKSLEIIRTTQSFLEEVTRYIKNEDNPDHSLGENVIDLVRTFLKNIEIEDEDLLNGYLDAMKVYIDHLFDIEDFTIPLELDVVENARIQVQKTNMCLNIFDDTTVMEMRNIINLPDRLHVKFKNHLKMYSGNLMISTNYEDIVKISPRAYKAKIKACINTIPTFETRLKKMRTKLYPIVLATVPSEMLKIQKLPNSKICEQFMRVERIISDLHELKKLPSDLNAPAMDWLIGSKRSGRAEDKAIKQWILDVCLFLQSATGKPLTLSHEAGNVIVLEMGLSHINFTTKANKIYDIADDFRSEGKLLS